jgi:DNA-binding transcriptional regulator GbsR (MarR family)
MRLVEMGGGIAQDLGLGRIVGQILVYLYLSDAERSMDRIVDDLGLSKAAVSVASRQLETLGLVRRVWKAGDRRSYYRTADNIATALQQGLLAFLRQKTRAVSEELDWANEELAGVAKDPGGGSDAEFLLARVQRARLLRDRASKLLESRLVDFFVKP